MNMTILIADDHALVRRGIMQVLLDEFAHHNAVIREVSTGTEALALVEKDPPTVVVLDLNLPDKNGLEVLKEIKLRRPELPVIILSLYPEEQYGIRALRAGASGYLTKESAPEELVVALKKVLDGRKYISESLAEQLAMDRATNSPETLYQKLSDRELEVLQMLGRGKTISQISEELSLSVKTISTYRARILEKLHLSTTAEIIRYALDYRLVE